MAEAIADGLLVTAPAWPAHAALFWLAKFLQKSWKNIWRNQPPTKKKCWSGVKLKVSMAKISEVFGGAAAIVKGMGITFGEMLNPTITEDYPDAPAKFQERFRGVHELQRDGERLGKNASPVSCARPRVLRNASILKRPRTPTNCASAAVSVTPRFITSDYNRCIFWRLLRGSLSHGRDYAWPRFRDRQLQHLNPDLPARSRCW